MHKLSVLLLMLFGIGNITATPRDVLADSYGRLSLATEIGVISNSIMSGSPDTFEPDGLAGLLASETLRFELGAIRMRPIVEAAPYRIIDTVSKPEGSVVHVVTGLVQFGDGRGGKAPLHKASASWSTAPYLTSDWKRPLSEFLGIVDPGQRYRFFSSVDVRLSLKGRTKAYRALVLSESKVLLPDRFVIFDNVVGGEALVWASELDDALYPDAFEMPRFETHPAVAAFSARSTHEPAACVAADPRSPRICCDSATASCSVEQLPAQQQSMSIARSKRSKAGPAQAIDYCQHLSSSQSSGLGASGSMDHWTGQHYGSATGYRRCAYFENGTSFCGNSCAVYFGNVSHGDTGGVVSSCHKTGAKTIEDDNYAPLGGTISCNGAFALGASSCLFCSCSISITIGSPATNVTVSPSPVWEWGTGFKILCSRQSPCPP